MTGTISIRPGMQLGTVTGMAFCRLGAIVSNAEGRLYGLTARHILDREDGALFDTATGGLVGRAIADRPVLVSDGEFFETIGVIELADVSVDRTDALTMGLGAVDPENAIGHVIRKVQSECGETTGVVEGYGGSIAFQAPASEEFIFLRNVIELSFEPADGATERGEAGAPIMDRTGGLLGLLMAGTRHRAYAAPVKPFLELYGFKFLRPRLDLDPEATTAKEELSFDLRNAAYGAAQLRNDISSENSAARDPYGEHVPQRLLDLLAEAG